MKHLFIVDFYLENNLSCLKSSLFFFVFVLSFSSLDLAALIASWGWGGGRSIWQYSISPFFDACFKKRRIERSRTRPKMRHQQHFFLSPFFCNWELQHHARACSLDGVLEEGTWLTIQDKLILIFKKWATDSFFHFLWRKMKTRKKMEKKTKMSN